MSHEQRRCHWCRGCGTVVEDALYDQETGKLVQALVTCWVCEGSGEVSVYVYERAARRPA